MSKVRIICFLCGIGLSIYLLSVANGQFTQESDLGIDTETCETVCWYGVELGRTPRHEVDDILRNLPIDNFSRQQLYGNNHIRYLFTIKSDSLYSYSSVWIDFFNDIVNSIIIFIEILPKSEISINLTTDICTFDFLTEFGEPTYVIPPKWSQTIEIIYSDQNMIIEVFLPRAELETYSYRVILVSDLGYRLSTLRDAYTWEQARTLYFNDCNFD